AGRGSLSAPPLDDAGGVGRLRFRPCRQSGRELQDLFGAAGSRKERDETLDGQIAERGNRGRGSGGEPPLKGVDGLGPTSLPFESVGQEAPDGEGRWNFRDELARRGLYRPVVAGQEELLEVEAAVDQADLVLRVGEARARRVR